MITPVVLIVGSLVILLGIMTAASGGIVTGVKRYAVGILLFFGLLVYLALEALKHSFVLPTF
jgi:hypothetical protein